MQLAPKKVQVPNNDEISIIYLYMEKNGIEILFVINNIFSFQVTIGIIRNDEDPKLETMDEWQHRKYWSKWKEYILTKLNTLEKCEVFGPVVQTLEIVKLVRYKGIFIRKYNEKNEIMRYKVWLIVQGFL